MLDLPPQTEPVLQSPEEFGVAAGAEAFSDDDTDEDFGDDDATAESAVDDTRANNTDAVRRGGLGLFRHALRDCPCGHCAQRRGVNSP